MTMGTRFACMGTGTLPAWRGILPALIFNGNFSDARSWHDPCAGGKALQRSLPPQTHAEGRPGLAALVQRPYPPGGLLLALRQGRDLRADLLLPRHQAVSLCNGIEQKVGPDVSLRPWAQLLSEPCQRFLLLGAGRKTHIESGQHRVTPAIDEGGRHLDGMACNQLVDQRFTHCAIRPLPCLPLEVLPDAPPQLLERLAAAVIPGEVVVERRQLLGAQVDDLDVEAHGASGQGRVPVV